MAIEILEETKAGYPIGKAKYIFLLMAPGDLDTLKVRYPHNGPAVDASIAVDWMTGASYALGDDGWIQGA